ncbi:unnamed protein product [Peniophora sp. CBMAI 1063]|nr:unnamed protein product [Peniophora sp. CBMAI 1063]
MIFPAYYDTPTCSGPSNDRRTWLYLLSSRRVSRMSIMLARNSDARTWTSLSKEHRQSREVVAPPHTSCNHDAPVPVVTTKLPCFAIAITVYIYIWGRRACTDAKLLMLFRILGSA